MFDVLKNNLAKRILVYLYNILMKFLDSFCLKRRILFLESNLTYPKKTILSPFFRDAYVMTYAWFRVFGDIMS